MPRSAPPTAAAVTWIECSTRTRAGFAIGARLASCCLVVEWDRYGEHHHNLELDDGLTMSWARLDADLDDPAPFTVCQLGPRRLWDGVEAAYDWWHEHGEPGLDQFGFHCDDGRPMAVAQRARQGGSRAVDWQRTDHDPQ